MALSDITEKEVRAALAEYKSLTREELKKRYGFGESRSYFLIVDRKRYNSKTVLVIAHRFLPDSPPPLTYNQFGGGNAVKKRLEKMSPAFKVSDEGDYIGPLAIAVDDGDSYDATDETDARDVIRKAIFVRRGQAQFRSELMKAYDGRCAMTGCAVREILEAAHISPHLGSHTNHVTNGLLLRADMHTLYDLHLITVDPATCLIYVDEKLSSSKYKRFHGSELCLPKDPNKHPNKQALKKHWDNKYE